MSNAAVMSPSFVKARVNDENQNPSALASSPASRTMNDYRNTPCKSSAYSTTSKTSSAEKRKYLETLCVNTMCKSPLVLREGGLTTAKAPEAGSNNAVLPLKRRDSKLPRRTSGDKHKFQQTHFVSLIGDSPKTPTSTRKVSPKKRSPKAGGSPKQKASDDGAPSLMSLFFWAAFALLQLYSALLVVDYHTPAPAVLRDITNKGEEALHMAALENLIIQETFLKGDTHFEAMIKDLDPTFGSVVYTDESFVTESKNEGDDAEETEEEVEALDQELEEPFYAIIDEETDTKIDVFLTSFLSTMHISTESFQEVQGLPFDKQDLKSIIISFLDYLTDAVFSASHPAAALVEDTEALLSFFVQSLEVDTIYSAEAESFPLLTFMEQFVVFARDIPEEVCAVETMTAAFQVVDGFLVFENLLFTAAFDMILSSMKFAASVLSSAVQTTQEDDLSYIGVDTFVTFGFLSLLIGASIALSLGPSVVVTPAPSPAPLVILSNPSTSKLLSKMLAPVITAAAASASQAAIQKAVAAKAESRIVGNVGGPTTDVENDALFASAAVAKENMLKEIVETEVADEIIKLRTKASNNLRSTRLAVPTKKAIIEPRILRSRAIIPLDN